MLGPLIMLLGASTAVKTTCSSTMKGDYAYEACGGFCKESKKSSHCKWCKCKQCSYCASGGASSISSATDAAAPGSTPVSSIGESPFKKNATKKKRRVKVQAPAMSDAPVAASPATAAPSDGTSAAARKTCRSGIKGDFAYEACGGFCKEAKKLNHCKWCKCKDCGFCSGSAAAAGAKPRDGDGSGGGGSSSSSGGGGGGGGGGAGGLKVTDCSLDRHIVFNHCSLSAIQVTCDSARSWEIAPLIVDKQIEISHGNETQSQVQAQSVTFSRRV